MKTVKVPATFLEISYICLFYYPTVLIDKAEELVGTTEEKKAAQEAEQEEEISSKELEELEEVLEKVADERSEKQRQQLELETLKQDVEEYQEV